MAFKKLPPLMTLTGSSLLLLYALVIFADFIAPYSANWADRRQANAPPSGIYIVDLYTRQLTHPYILRHQRDDPAEPLDSRTLYPVHWFTHAEPYRLLGVWPSDIHLLGVETPAQLNLLGTDINGRDIFSRLLFGGRISLTIGFLSLLVAFPIGLAIGGIAGYVGGWLDNVLMRLCEVLMSVPSLYLLISLAAILPAGLSSAWRFAMVTVIMALVGWVGLARVIRGMVLSIKQQEFVEAGHALGMSHAHILWRHILPQTSSYVLIAATLGVPGYLLSESGLSFLGLGIQQPDASWGNMLKEAQDINNLVNAPWMLAPGVLIVITVLCFNILGDGLRDWLDPQSKIFTI